MPTPDPAKPWINDIGDYEVIENKKGALSSFINQAAFLTAIANLEWSRGYTWYVELDDVPFPFQRGGIIGLPVTDINYQICTPESFTWTSGMNEFKVPKSRGVDKVTLTVLDDEQATIFTFFERWYNNIYNSRVGVLPVIEAAKCLSIYKLKATRNPVRRHTYRYDMREGKIGEMVEKVLDARELLVYPDGPLQEDEKMESNPRRYTIDFVIVNQENADYGDPSKNDGREGMTILGHKIGATDGTTFLDKASNYF